MTDNYREQATGPFKVGDKVQLSGPKGRLYTITLEVDGAFGTHRGDIRHNDIIGKPEGSVIANQHGVEYLALRPLLTDFVMSMPRGAAIIYPKDSAQIIVEGDIFPGARVIEAGVGSGALSLYLLRAIGPTGRLDSFERREEFAEIARANVVTHTGRDPDNWQIHLGDLQEQLPFKVKSGQADRVVLDMLAPWECIEPVADALVPGGLVLGYVATVTQLSRFTEALRSSGHFAEPSAWESMVRGWHLEGLAVRPEHRMIGHTGFLVTARRIAPNTVLPSFKARAAKNNATDADVSIWNPDHLETRQVSEKKLRKTVRSAISSAESRLDQRQ
jgi:tRNA (adenine57-N1/adenine58-N1)-methyltransferase